MLLFDEERVMLLSLGELLFGLGLVLLPRGDRKVLAGPCQLLLEFGVAGGFLSGFLNDLSAGKSNLSVRRSSETRVHFG